MVESEDDRFQFAYWTLLMNHTVELSILLLTSIYQLEKH